jgi:hypothetical protein
MKLRRALRGLKLLRTVRPEDGAHDAVNSVDLKLILMKRFSVSCEDLQPASPCYELSWVDWKSSLGELGIELHHSGARGNASLGNGKAVAIRLDTGQWQVQEESSGGWATVAMDWGRESLRAYLTKNSVLPGLLLEST